MVSPFFAKTFPLCYRTDFSVASFTLCDLLCGLWKVMGFSSCTKATVLIYFAKKLSSLFVKKTAIFRLPLN